MSVSSLRRFDHGWVAGWWNLRQGLAITRQQPDLYVKLVLLYSLPPFAAAGLVLFAPRDTPWYQPLVSLLPLITIVVAPVVLMHAVDAGRCGERSGVSDRYRSVREDERCLLYRFQRSEALANHCRSDQAGGS